MVSGRGVGRNGGVKRHQTADDDDLSHAFSSSKKKVMLKPLRWEMVAALNSHAQRAAA